MTKERKAELFDGALNVILSRMVYSDRTEVEEVLESIGYTEDEIKTFISGTIYADIDEDD